MNHHKEAQTAAPKPLNLEQDKLALRTLALGVLGMMLLPILGVFVFLMIGVSIDTLPAVRSSSATTAAFSLTTFAQQQEAQQHETQQQEARPQTTESLKP